MPGSSSQDTLRGDRLGRYRLIAELGSGGMADVYLATSEGKGGFQKLVVLKRLRSQDDPEAVTMFMDEARLAARLNHPNVVQTFEACHEATYSFIVMEYLEGITLQRLRRRTRTQGIAVPLKLELHVLSKALAGLHHAHEMRDVTGAPLHIVHRDFTPQNLFITYNGECKVLDFGIAKAADSVAQTQAGMYKGKVAYMAPEQMSGQVADRRVDIFAAGVLLWEAAASRPMWEGLSSVAIFDRLSRGEMPSLKEFNPTIGEAYVALVERALSADLGRRFSTALELQQAVDHFRKAQGLVATPEELAQYVAYLFLEDRQRQRSIIDARLKSASSLPAGDAIAVGMPRIQAEPEPSGPPAVPAQDAGKTGTALLPGVTGARATPPRSSRLLRTARTLVMLGASFGAGMGLEHERPRLMRKVPTRWQRYLPAGVWASQGPAPLPSAPPRPLPAADPNFKVEAGRKPEKPISVRLKVDPPEARLVLDGVALPGNPFDGSFPPDRRLHVLEVQAPGYAALREGLQFEADVDAHYTLQREAPPAPRRKKHGRAQAR